MIRALHTYQLSRRGTELLDRPKDDQHENGEDLIDPLAGALKLEFPVGRTPAPQFRQLSFQSGK